jgi:tight adherence protein B
MSMILIVFFFLVFASVFLLLRATTAELISRRGSNRDLKRILETDLDSEVPTEPRFLRRPRLERLSNLQKAIERRSELDTLRRLSDQAGLEVPMYRLVLYSMALAGITFGAFMLSPLAWWIAAMAALGAAAMPVLGLLWLRSRRISKIDMQLADAVDMIAREFGITAADLSYGNDPRSALLAMLERAPSVSLHGFVTAILVQRETGGNLAETLDHISEVIRQRFRFERKLRTLSAEGRLSAWILIAVPFALAAVLHFTSPNYLGRLLDDPRGPTLLSGGAVLMTIGVIWIRRISRVVI